MQEVDAKICTKTVDIHLELRKPVEARFAGPPVILFGSVAADLADPCERNALAPVVHQLLLRPARIAQPRLQIRKDLVLNRNTKWC